jgi:hypothetical protein
MKYIAHYLGLVRNGEEQLAEAFKVVADRHYNDYEIRELCRQMAGWSLGHQEALEPMVKRYGAENRPDPLRLRGSLFHGSRAGTFGQLRDLQDLSLLANAVRTNYTILIQAAISLKDQELEKRCEDLGDQTNRQIEWLCTRIKNLAPQAVTVPPNLPSEGKASVPKKQNVAAIPDQVWAPLIGALLTLIVGLLGFAVGRPWLFPSLGPTAALQAETPAQPTARFYNVMLGHLGGLLAGFLAVMLFNVWNDPVMLKDHQITLGRIGASAFALALTILLGLLLKASHPPASATTLLVTLGSIQTPADVMNLSLGVISLALIGEAIRRMRIGAVSRVPVEARIPANAGR